MPADRLGRYMTSRAFLERANAAIAKAVRALEAKGIMPAYTVHGVSNQTTQTGMAETETDRRQQALCNRLTKLSRTPASAHRVIDASASIAHLLQLAKTTPAHEETKFRDAIRERLGPVRSQPALAEWVLLLTKTDQTSDDACRDRAVVDDALFGQRVEAILRELHR
jgi:hypothetical protein